MTGGCGGDRCGSFHDDDGTWAAPLGVAKRELVSAPIVMLVTNTASERVLMTGAHT